MTKARIPDTFADAMTQVAGVLGWPECARIARRKERAIRKWSDPDTGTVPDLNIALALDRAFALAGGEGAPFRDAFSTQLDIQVERHNACRRQLAADAADFVREAGDLGSALIIAAQPGASQRDMHRVLVEAQQADGVLRRIKRRVPLFLRLATGARPGNVGGPQE